MLLAYLEIALAERIHTPGAAVEGPGPWASLPDEWPVLLEGNHQAPSHAPSPSTFDAYIALLTEAETAGLLSLAGIGFQDVADGEISPLTGVELKTPLLRRAPKHNNVQRYFVDPAWEEPLRLYGAYRNAKTTLLKQPTTKV